MNGIGAILSLARADRMRRYVQLTMDQGVPLRYAKDYGYVEVPLRGFRDKDGQLVDSVKANQTVRVEPAGSIKLTGPHRMLIQVNNTICDSGLVSQLQILDPDDGRGIDFPVTFRTALKAADVPWAVRIYLLA